MGFKMSPIFHKIAEFSKCAAKTRVRSPVTLSNDFLAFRHDSGGSIFVRRMDYSSFNVLPKQKINSYHIKMEDECSIGNDETRIFILSNLASNKLNKVPCVLCNSVLTVYDRYPLINGTFFLSPRQHNRTCIQVSTLHLVYFKHFSYILLYIRSNWKENQVS